MESSEGSLAVVKLPTWFLLVMLISTIGGLVLIGNELRARKRG